MTVIRHPRRGRLILGDDTLRGSFSSKSTHPALALLTGPSSKTPGPLQRDQTRLSLASACQGHVRSPRVRSWSTERGHLATELGYKPWQDCTNWSALPYRTVPQVSRASNEMNVRVIKVARVQDWHVVGDAVSYRVPRKSDTLTGRLGYLQVPSHGPRRLVVSPHGTLVPQNETLRD